MSTHQAELSNSKDVKTSADTTQPPLALELRTDTAATVTGASSAALKLSKVIENLERTMDLNQEKVRRSQAGITDEKSKKDKILDPHLDSILKVTVKKATFVYSSPWRTPQLTDYYGTGFPIEGEKIVTNAHVIANHAYVQVLFKDKIYEAKVEVSLYSCDLALLTVKNPEFWKKVKLVEFGGMLDLRDKVNVYGYPSGGREVSITEGIVSRIDVYPYSPQSTYLLAVQVDAAINPGNSGGPVFKNGKVVGVASQHYNNTLQSIGNIIPIPILYHFFKDIFTHTTPKGFPYAEMTVEGMDNINLRKYYGMKEEQTGVLITAIFPLSSLNKVLHKEDVILKINQYTMSNNGTITIENDQRINFSYIYSFMFIGDALTFTILRDKKEHVCSAVLEFPSGAHDRTLTRIYDRPPSFYINSGVILQPLTQNYYDAISNATIKRNPAGLYKQDFIKRKTPNEEVIFINNILENEDTAGYTGMVENAIKTINGKLIKNMTEVVRAFEENQTDMHVIRTYDKHVIVVKNMQEHEHKALLTRYNIAKDRSDDLPPRLKPVVALATTPAAITAAAVTPVATAAICAVQI